MGHTVLQVPVPPLEAFVRARTELYDAAYLFTEPAHAHVTALAPFVPRPTAADLTVVARIAAATAAFDVTLARLDTFANGIIHLVPEPDAGFRDLTARLWAAFPQCPPYAGQYAEVRPHLTLDLTSPEVTVGSTEALLGDVVPARCRAERLDLAWYAAGECRLLASWPLGGVPAPR